MLILFALYVPNAFIICFMKSNRNYLIFPKFLLLKEQMFNTPRQNCLKTQKKE